MYTWNTKLVNCHITVLLEVPDWIFTCRLSVYGTLVLPQKKGRWWTLRPSSRDTQPSWRTCRGTCFTSLCLALWQMTRNSWCEWSLKCIPNRNALFLSSFSIYVQIVVVFWHAAVMHDNTSLFCRIWAAGTHGPTTRPKPVMQSTLTRLRSTVWASTPTASSSWPLAPPTRYSQE